MPAHNWGDEDFDWNALNDAIRYCMRTWKRWGRIGSHGKEKYGTFRDHPYFWDGGIWSLCKPGYCYIGEGFWRFLYFKVDYYFTKPFTINTGLYRLGQWYQAQVYNYAVQQACKKYPHIVDEIVADLEGYSLVKPGLFGPIDGTVIHKKYWTTYGETDEH